MAAKEPAGPERARRAYEPPVVMPLGALSEVAGTCQAGASDSGLCFTGASAGACFSGTTAGGVSCQTGTTAS